MWPAAPGWVHALHHPVLAATMSAAALLGRSCPHWSSTAWHLGPWRCVACCPPLKATCVNCLLSESFYTVPYLPSAVGWCSAQPPLIAATQAAHTRHYVGVRCAHVDVCYYVLCCLVWIASQAGPGRDIISSGWQALSAGRPDMNSLVGLGATASFAVSCVAAALPALRWKTFFEEPAMLLGECSPRPVVMPQQCTRLGPAIQCVCFCLECPW